MITRTQTGLRAALAAVALSSWWMVADAQTLAGTSIDNKATVNYSVGGQAQAPIESSPTGNTTPGTGAGVETSFLVDNRVDLTVSELSTSATLTSPGALGAVLAFRVTNSGNSPQGYQLAVTEEAGTTEFGNIDNANFGLPNLLVRVDQDLNGTYDGTETATAIDVLAPGQVITVFVVSPTVPLTLVNGSFANVNLQARTAAPGPGGALLTESTGVNNPTTVEILFADGGRDATESDTDQFAIQSAALTISKTQTVLSDGFSTVNARAIPGAVVEYLITVANTSTTTAASAVSLTDPVPANTTFLLTPYAGEGVGITGGVTATCTADANDGDADGCGIAAGALSVGSGVIGNVAAGATVTVQFQVQIN